MAHTNIAAPILENVHRYGERTAYRLHRDGQWTSVSWADFGRRIGGVAAGLLQVGVQEGDAVAIMSANCPEWSWVDYACAGLKVLSVPIHATCTSETVDYILHQTKPVVAFAGTPTEVELIRQARCPSVRHIVLLRGSAPGAVSLQDFMADPRQATVELNERVHHTSPDDLWTLVYTSGTTGVVRGAMLSHGNILFQVESHRARLANLGEEDSSFCLLPLSHVFERAWTTVQFSWGMTQHYCDVSPEAIALLAEAQPSILCLVPRVLEKIHRGIQDKFAQKPRAVQAFLKACLAAALEAWRLRRSGRKVPRLLQLQVAVADRLVLKKIRGIFGGRLKHCVVGGAALTPEIQEFFLAAGVFINAGYGLSETTATVASTILDRSTPGAVGLALPGVELRLGEDGEVQVRGGNVMKGYYGDPEATRAVFTEDGWFRTGDVGALDAAGVLCITDRLKDLIKTSTGKYVAPQFLEAKLASSPLIEQAAIIGEGRSRLGALLVPDFARLEELARRLGVAFQSHDELVRCPEIVEHVRKVLDEALHNVAKHEKVQQFALLSRPFTIQAGELTPTLKLRRKVILERYQELIEAWNTPREVTA